MNAREFWANEAEKARNTSVLSTPNTTETNSDKNEPVDDFRTGYWRERNTFVFSTYVYNATSQSDESMRAFMNKVASIQKAFSIEGCYSFDFRFKFVDKPRYDFGNTYGNSSETGNRKIKPYILKVPNTRSETDLKAYFEESKLPNEYYMDLFDYKLGAPADGGAHVNTSNPYQSCYFGLYVASDWSNIRTVVHESLHPVLPHIYNGSSPMLGVFVNFFEAVKKLVNQKESENKSETIYRQEINEYIGANKDKLKDAATSIRENIMTTEAIAMRSGNERYIDYVSYLYGYLGLIDKRDAYGYIVSRGDGILNKGTKIDQLQVDSIVNQIK